MNIVPEERFGVIVLTNAADEINITSGITEALIGEGEKPVPSEVKGLPNSKMVAGIYLPARRMHNSFLKIYGYLSLLQVKSLDSNTIELSIGGQKATLRQTAPYVFERVEAIGPVLQYHLGTVVLPFYLPINGKKFN